MSQWSIAAELTFNTTVIIEAESAEEAKAKFDACDFEDDGLPAAELINWHARGKPKEDR